MLALLALVALLASLQGILFAAGRNMYSLSRAGYYPTFLSLTGAKHKTPWVALVATAVLGLVILALVLLVVPAISPDAAGAASGVILFIAVFGAVISYVMQMVSFVLLRRKFPAAVRPYRSPTGVWGAVVAGVISVAAFLGIVLNSAFQVAVVTIPGRLRGGTGRVRARGAQAAGAARRRRSTRCRAGCRRPAVSPGRAARTPAAPLSRRPQQPTSAHEMTMHLLPGSAPSWQQMHGHPVPDSLACPATCVRCPRRTCICT